MGWIALVLSAAAAGALALPSPGLFAAMSLAILGMACGLLGYRRRQDPAARRLAGAAAVTVGSLALFLAGARYLLTLAALSRLESLL